MNLSTSQKLFVAALDFGTAYSGYAFQTKDEFNRNPLQIQTCAKWYASNIVSEKTASCILLDNDKKLVSFGYEAEDEYGHIVQECTEQDPETDDYKYYYFFKQFKMALFRDQFNREQKLTKDTQIVDETGKKMSAMIVIGLCIEYLKDHLNNELKKQTGNAFDNDDIDWIITVPAIWDDEAKQFMRDAAKLAGIGTESNLLTLSLEPESASLYCQLLPISPTDQKLKREASVNVVQRTAHQMEKVTLRQSKSEEKPDEKVDRSDIHSTTLRIRDPGEKYMVLDLGGGTADITVHEKETNGRIREILAASGGPWGGTAVDKNFFELMNTLFGKKTMDTFKREFLTDHLELCRSFEVKKRNVRNTFTVISLPAVLMDIFRECSNNSNIEKAISNSIYGKEVKLNKGKLHIHENLMKGFFAPVIDAIVNHVKDLMVECANRGEEIGTILMVGGFSDCPYVETAVHAHFGTRKIIKPPQSSLAVLKGSVIFGHRKDGISKRVTKYTYGYEAWPLFKDGVHKEENKQAYGEVVCCTNVFQLYIKKNQSISSDEPALSIHHPASADQVDMGISLYITQNDQVPMYINDPGVRYLGKVTFPLSPYTGKERTVEGRLYFGETELKFEARDCLSGDIHQATFQCF